MDENNGVEIMQVRLSNRCQAIVTFSSPPSREGYEMLVEMLKIQQEAFPTEAEVAMREWGTGEKRERIRRFAALLSR